MFIKQLKNQQNKNLTVKRDFLGGVPLYIYEDRDKFIFSDSLKKIVDSSYTNTGLNKYKVIEHLSDNLLNNYQTIYTNISEAIPGASYIIKNNRLSLTNKSNFSIHEKKSLEDTLLSVLQANLNDNFAFELSGGLDSASALATWLRNDYQASSYSMIYPDLPCDEKLAIDKFVSVFPHQNNQIKFKPASLGDVKSFIQETALIPDAPNGLSAQALLEMAAKNNVKTLVTGMGGDHLFTRWQAKQRTSFLQKIKSFFTNDLKLRKFTGKRYFPFLSVDAECNYLSNLLEEDMIFDNEILQELFSAKTNYTLTYSYLLAEQYGLNKFNPFLSKEMITFALFHQAGNTSDKITLRKYLSELDPLKPDFTVTYKLFFKSNPEIYQILEEAIKKFSDLINVNFCREKLSLQDNWMFQECAFFWNLLGVFLLTESHKK